MNIKSMITAIELAIDQGAHNADDLRAAADFLERIADLTAEAPKKSVHSIDISGGDDAYWLEKKLAATKAELDEAKRSIAELEKQISPVRTYGDGVGAYKAPPEKSEYTATIRDNTGVHDYEIWKDQPKQPLLTPEMFDLMIKTFDLRYEMANQKIPTFNEEKLAELRKLLVRP